MPLLRTIRDDLRSVNLKGRLSLLLAMLLCSCAQVRITVPLPLPGGNVEELAVTVVGDKAPNPLKVAEVLRGERAEANAAWWGFDPDNATEALQSAIRSGASVVLVPDMGRPWLVDPLFLEGNQELVFAKGTVVEARPGSFTGGGDCLFTIHGQEKVTLRGYGAIWRMRKPDYESSPYRKAEWRHTLSLRSARDIRVLGLRLESSGGDGIYLGRLTKTGSLPYCENVLIRDVVLSNHYRQGISIVSARHLRVENCLLTGTRGTPPQAGIDFEPNRNDESLMDCLLRGCLIEKNAGAGILIFLKQLSGASAPVSIRVESSIVRNNFFQLWLTSGGGKPKGTILFQGSDISWPRFIRSVPGLEVSFPPAANPTPLLEER